MENINARVSPLWVIRLPGTVITKVVSVVYNLILSHTFAHFSRMVGSQRFPEFFDRIVGTEAIGARERERKEFLVFRITNARPIGRAKLLLDRENVGRTDVREVVILSYIVVVRPGRQLTRIWSRHQLNSPLRTYRELKRSFKGGRRHGKVKAVLVLSRSDEFHATALPSVDINVFITRLRLTILQICYFLFARIVASSSSVYPRCVIRTYCDDLPRYSRYRFRVCSARLFFLPLHVPATIAD